MCLKKIRMLFLKRKINVLKLDIVYAEQERARHLSGKEPEDLKEWITLLTDDLKKAEEQLADLMSNVYPPPIG